MHISPEDLIKLLLAVAIGGSIGFERELHNKAAGLRTITLITVGATLFTMLSMKFNDDRIIANIVSGVGFLGAGVIMFAEGKVKGLTTASSVWAAAAVGMAIGVGQYELAGAATLVIIIVLWLFTSFDRLIDAWGRELRTYQIKYSLRKGKFAEIEKLIAANGLKIMRKRKMKDKDNLTTEWEVRGALDSHNSFVDKLLADKEVLEVKY